MRLRSYFLLLMPLFLFNMCQKRDKLLFERLQSDRTNLTFNNKITENDSVNVLDFEYIYNGGGVGIGDFNNDGLQDIFFSGNQVPSKLYLNKGNLTFEDITEEAGIVIPHWATGVSLVDINHDGWLDIHVCTAHPKASQNAPNLVFLNKGIGKNGQPCFTEISRQIGLADEGYSTQAAFFDYDNDGDLDMFLLTNALETYNRALVVGQKTTGFGRSTDRLYRNDGIEQTNGLPHFTNVSKEAGITTEGWGLGIGIADFNHDGWLDVYCANDFQSNDLLWINNQNGTFTNRIADCLKHQSHNSMGMDIADINNDGLPEIVNLDMLPDDNLRQKTMFSRPNYDQFNLTLEKKYQPQYVRNTLQLNRGSSLDSATKGLPVFSEIGLLSDIYATDWSWSPLLADFNNDGFRDLFITNGYPKDVTNLDFSSYTAQQVMSFSDPQDDKSRKLKLDKMTDILGVKKSNFMFKNTKTLQFEDVTEKWGLKIPSFSNGAAYADFDNDGDLDIVVNNINDEALFYKNTLLDKPKNTKNAYFLSLKLEGNAANLQGFGAEVTLFCKGEKQYLQHSPYRGYKSTMTPNLHFGLGENEVIDSLYIKWLSGKTQVLVNVKANQTLVLKEKNALNFQNAKPFDTNNATVFKHPFNEAAQKYGLNYTHEEEDFVDFKYAFLLPHKHSQETPPIAVGDLNGDGLADVFIGGSAFKRATVFYQNANSTFRKQDFLEKTAEDTGVLIFDADGDKDNDIYCVSGSSELRDVPPQYQDRFYRNEGKDGFVLDEKALPKIESCGSMVAASDFDKDGDLDLFVGGRVSPLLYPQAPQSYLLQNNGNGIFQDITTQIAPELQHIGMITAATWADIDADKYPDLVVTGEYMPVVFFKNNAGKNLSKKPMSDIDPSVGWFKSIAAADFDKDGDMDFVAGNLGLNSLYKASQDEPVCVYAKDFDQNGTLDPILCRYIQGEEYPSFFRESMTDQMVVLKKMFTRYEIYGKKTFKDIFKPAMTKNALILRATDMASIYIENTGNGTFKRHHLPIEAQFAPITGILPIDFDGDNNLDMITIGNDYATEVMTGRYDASIGVVLKGDGNGAFKPLTLNQSGFYVRGDAKAIAKVRLKNGKTLILTTQNRDKLMVFEAQSNPYFK